MKDNITEQLELLEMMKGVGKVRTEEEIEDDLDREFKERMKREEEQREQERLMRERLQKEEEERRQAQYELHKEVFDFIKTINQLEPEDYYAIVELQNGEQYECKPAELKHDDDYIMFYIMKRKWGQLSWGEYPWYRKLEVNVNEIKGIKLFPEEQKEIVTIKKTEYGKWRG